jgi:hypothetical protein
LGKSHGVSTNLREAIELFWIFDWLAASDLGGTTKGLLARDYKLNDL